MERFAPLLLQVWRLACREPRISMSAASIAAVVARRMPCDRLLIRRLDQARGHLETLATVGAPLAASPLSRADSPDALLEWCRRGRPLRGTPAKLHGRLPGTVPPDWPGHTLICPLTLDSEPIGLLALGSDDPRGYPAEHDPLVLALSEPLAVALRNDLQLRELQTLREAAEADRRSLLQRLGRQDIADTIVGERSGLRTVMREVELVARSDAPVLILGETGTGKEVVARAIHTRSSRTDGPFLRVNCGAIPPELVDSELFGHERGSFTGATALRRGWFERAHGGTLFLDEIGELTPAVQVRLLRILQDGSFERVGGQHPLHANVRIVAATHQDLATMVSAGRFRADLWYRIHVFPIRLPPLRERPEDIPGLAEHFARRAAQRLGLPTCAPDPGAVASLTAYPWPGNVRELSAVIERAAILGEGKRLAVAEALGTPPIDAPASPAALAAPADRSTAAPAAVETSLDEAIRDRIESALARCLGRIEGPFGAARLLAVNPNTLRARMRRLGIDWTRFRPAKTDHPRHEPDRPEQSR